MELHLLERIFILYIISRIDCCYRQNQIQHKLFVILYDINL
jgi:hypothetical protein